jgi:hypothetical protein
MLLTSSAYPGAGTAGVELHEASSAITSMDRKDRGESRGKRGGLNRRKLLKYAAVGGLLGPGMTEA